MIDTLIEQTETLVAPGQAVLSDDPLIMTQIFRPENNLVVWQRSLSTQLLDEIKETITQKPNWQMVLQTSQDEAFEELADALSDWRCAQELSCDITQLIEMYSVLFDAKRVGVRLTVLENTMCPRFHVDRVVCRLVTTYYGQATQWIKGKNSVQVTQDYPDALIEQMNTGDVALLKGTHWEGNEQHGIVHRSPPATEQSLRLLLTIDFID